MRRRPSTRHRVCLLAYDGLCTFVCPSTGLRATWDSARPTRCGIISGGSSVPRRGIFASCSDNRRREPQPVEIGEAADALPSLPGTPTLPDGRHRARRVGSASQITARLLLPLALHPLLACSFTIAGGG